MTFGEYLKEILFQREITQEELAVRMSTTKQWISHLCNEKEAPGRRALKKLCDALGMTRTELLAYKTAENIKEQDMTMQDHINRSTLTQVIGELSGQELQEVLEFAEYKHKKMMGEKKSIEAS